MHVPSQEVNAKVQRSLQIIMLFGEIFNHCLHKHYTELYHSCRNPNQVAQMSQHLNEPQHSDVEQ